jgi:hypothetical protein
MEEEPSTDEGEISEPEGTTSSAPIEEPSRTWWQRIAAARNKKHAPGVWVVYFSMAALPIFGIGQGFIFNQNDDSRRFVFKLLFVYVAAALGLLLTTSFLGLRRYLRQRRIEMPTQMAGAWLGTGAIMIVALLLFCMILPRRNAEYSISDLPAFAGSPDDLQANRWGFGSDGPEEEDAKRQVTREDAEKESGQPGDDEGTGKEKSKDGKGKSEADKSGQQQGKSEQKSDRGEGDKKSSDKGSEKNGGEKNKGGEKQGNEDGGSKKKQSDDNGQSQQDQQGKQSKSKQNENKSDDSGEQREDRSGERKSDAEKRAQEQQEKSEQSGEPQEKQDQTQKTNSDSKQKQQNSRKFDPSSLAKQLGGGIGMLLKLLYWLIVILIVAWFLWRYWAQVREAIRNFIQAVREFWARLFGGSAAPAAEVATESAVAVAPPRPFSAFPDPFQSGLANQLPLDQLIKYSFEAFEAWARERGVARSQDQTPHEFAQQVAQSGTGVSQEAIRLAELYSRAAYSRDTMPQASGQLLQQLWQRLTAATL